MQMWKERFSFLENTIVTTKRLRKELSFLFILCDLHNIFTYVLSFHLISSLFQSDTLSFHSFTGMMSSFSLPLSIFVHGSMSHLFVNAVFSPCVKWKVGDAQV